MTKKEFAEVLNGREYRSEITREEEKIAKENGLFVVFGASDDLMEFRGAINEELDAYEGTTAYVSKNGLFQSECDCEDCIYAERDKLNNNTAIEQIWCSPDCEFTWSYKTEIPHETFDIFENGKPYCRGIVCNVEDLK